MIIKNSNGLFGAKLAIIKDRIGNYFTISTAKEGLFDGLSTMIIEGIYPSIRPSVKFIYSKSLRKEDRRAFHDVITETIDSASKEDDFSLYGAVNSFGSDLKERGIITELINIAQKKDDITESSKKEGTATDDLVNAVSTNPVYALKAHEKDLQKYFDKSPEAGSEKLIAIYFEYLYLNLNLLDRSAFDILGGDRRAKFLNALGRPIVGAAMEKYYTGNLEEVFQEININLDEASVEYSQCDELIPPGERMFSEKAMTTVLSRRVDGILNNGDQFLLTSINVLTGIAFIREHQIDLPDLIAGAARELGI